MMRSKFLPAFGLLIAGFVVGCGGSKKDKEATPPKETIPVIEGGPKAGGPGENAAKGEI